MGFYTGGLPSDTGYDRYGESPYYEPPAPWKILAEHDWAGAYEFSMLVVWRNEQTGAMVAAADSGCSCPTPFSQLDLDTDALEVRSPEDLKPLLDWLEPEDANAVHDLKAKVRAALSKDGR
jgi:hypothetical protein